MTLDTPSRQRAGDPIHRPAADREGSPSPDAVGGRAARLGAQIRTFIAIGVVSTAAYVVLYGGLRTFMSAVATNAVALFVTAIGNTAANRRLTFRVRGRASMLRDQVAGMGAFAIALAITTSVVGLLAILAPRAGRQVEVAVLVLANVLATVVRFILLKAAIEGDRASDTQRVADRFEGTVS